MNRPAVFRVLDANLNRLREGLRVVEEYYRFYSEVVSTALILKELRHGVRSIEEGLPRTELLAGRDSDHDPFRSGSEARELERSGIEELVIANIRRAQEHARVLVEYLRFFQGSPLSQIATDILFRLYTIEKEWGTEDGQEKK